MSVDDSLRDAMPVEAELAYFEIGEYGRRDVTVRLTGGAEITLRREAWTPEFERAILDAVGQLVNQRLAELGRIVVTQFAEDPDDEDDE